MPSAMPLITVTPAAASPRPRPRATSIPSAPARRAPTIATAGSSSCAQPRQPLAVTRDVQHRGRVRGLREAGRVLLIVPAAHAQPGPRGSVSCAVGIERLERTLDVVAALPGERGDEIGVGERKQLGDVAAMAARVFDVRREHRDECRAAQADVARRHVAGPPPPMRCGHAAGA